jgi:phosphoribosylformimino-5-aminoimidazole carboxamide ribotide isomerase
MDLLAAIDLRGGHAVRLVQGDFDREEPFGDPLAIADRFAAAGAPWLHVVDLDAARSGRPVNRTVVLEIARRSAVPVQTGGGVRTERDAVELIGAGVARVVLGTAGLQDPELLAACATRFPSQIVLGLDYRRRSDGRREVAVRGWTESSGRSLEGVLGTVDHLPLGAVVVTSIERDGTLGGPDLDGLRDLLDLTAVPVVASGGVGTVGDLADLARLRSPGSGRRLAGAVVGKALLGGRMSIGEAVAACATSE